MPAPDAPTHFNIPPDLNKPDKKKIDLKGASELDEDRIIPSASSRAAFEEGLREGALMEKRKREDELIKIRKELSSHEEVTQDIIVPAPMPKTEVIPEKKVKRNTYVARKFDLPEFLSEISEDDAAVAAPKIDRQIRQREADRENCLGKIAQIKEDMRLFETDKNNSDEDKEEVKRVLTEQMEIYTTDFSEINEQLQTLTDELLVAQEKSRAEHEE